MLRSDPLRLGRLRDPLGAVAGSWEWRAYAVAALVCLYVSIVPVGGIDFWMQAKIGSLILQDGEIPRTLLFPFTEVVDQPFHAHEWLTSILFHELLVNIGAPGLPFFTGLLGLGYFLLGARLGYLRSHANSAVAVLGGLLAVATENYRHTLRPELISLVLMGAYWICLERFYVRPTLWRGLLPVVLTVAWANVHGSFILAPALATLYWVGHQMDGMRRQASFHLVLDRQSKGIGYVGVAIWMACLVTPFGTELLQFVVGFGSAAASGFGLLEWGPTLGQKNLGGVGMWLALGAWILTLVVMAIHVRRVSAIDGLVFLFFTLLALRAVRFPIYLGWVACFIVSKYIAGASATTHWQKQLHQFSTFLALFALGMCVAFGNASGQRPSSAGMWKLSDAMAQVLSDPQYHGNVFNSMELGAELTYWGYPRLRPSIDCRVDSYGVEYVSFQRELLKNDALLTEFLLRYDVRYLLLERGRIEQLSAAGVWKKQHWELIYQDGLAAFMRRVDPPL